MTPRDRALVWAVSLAACVFLWRLAETAALHLPVPYDLNFESPNLTTIELLRADTNPYDPAIYAGPPFLLTLYTPLYHQIVAALPPHPENPFLVGRVVAFAAILAAAACLFFAAGRRTPASLGFVAFGLFFAIGPIQYNASLLKNDALGLFFSALAVVLMHNARERRWMPFVCALLVVASLASKQSLASAGAACTLHLLFADRARLGRFLAWGALLGLAYCGAAQAVWGNGFWYSTIGALQQPIRLDHAVWITSLLFAQPLVPGVAVAAALTGWRAARAERSAVLRRSPYPLYALTSAAVYAATVGKEGASTNYYTEVALAQLLWLVFALAPSWPGWMRANPATAGILGLCCALELALPQAQQRIAREQADAEIAGIRRELAALPFQDPILLVPYTHQLGPTLTRRPTFNDPFHYRMLWRDGAMDLGDMVRSIDQRYYDVVLLPANPRPDRLSPPQPLLQAIRRNYAVARAGAGQHLLVRRDAGPRER